MWWLCQYWHHAILCLCLVVAQKVPAITLERCRCVVSKIWPQKVWSNDFGDTNATTCWQNVRNPHFSATITVFCRLASTLNSCRIMKHTVFHTWTSWTQSWIITNAWPLTGAGTMFYHGWTRLDSLTIGDSFKTTHCSPNVSIVDWWRSSFTMDSLRLTLCSRTMICKYELLNPHHTLPIQSYTVCIYIYIHIYITISKYQYDIKISYNHMTWWNLMIQMDTIPLLRLPVHEYQNRIK